MLLGHVRPPRPEMGRLTTDRKDPGELTTRPAAIECPCPGRSGLEFVRVGSWYEHFTAADLHRPVRHDGGC
jgi:hypothetical protein